MRHLLLAPIDVTSLVATPSRAQETVRIDATAKVTLFPHFRERMFGSGHATVMCCW